MKWPPLCTTCQQPYVKDGFSVCSNSFHCCRDCKWYEGQVVWPCPTHVVMELTMSPTIHRRMTWFSPMAYGPDVQACARKMSAYRTCEAGTPGCLVRHGSVKLKWVPTEPEDRKARRLMDYVNEC